MSSQADAPKRPSLLAAIPVLHVGSSVAAEEFYCGRLGFRRHFAHYLDDTRPDPCYSGISRDGVWLHVSSFSGDGVSGGVVHLEVDDVDALHAELIARGVAIDSGPMDQTWGARELYVKDPDRNTIRFVDHRRG
ncbi:MAG: VOC family protein [Acidobacteriota bacterium]